MQNFSRVQRLVIGLLVVALVCIFGTLALVLLNRNTSPPITPSAVVAAFRSAQLEAENARPLTKEDYGLAPLLCDGQRFLIPSLGPDKGGRVFVCANAQDRDRLAGYYQNLAKSSAAFFSWVFVKNNVVVQLNGDLPENVARQYEQAIP